MSNNDQPEHLRTSRQLTVRREIIRSALWLYVTYSAALPKVKAQYDRLVARGKMPETEVVAWQDAIRIIAERAKKENGE